ESMRPRALPQLISLELNCSDC
ncbi:tol-pal system-associated acyl-CoA thioesterase, partial|nr:tol-pal system-associated acyl-CoA thioesterase [Escherichia coli]